ncbi:unnamed protein product [Malus baccata var. baccata]
MLTVGFEPTPFRTRTLIWRLRPTRPYQLVVRLFVALITQKWLSKYFVCVQSATIVPPPTPPASKVSTSNNISQIFLSSSADKASVWLQSFKCRALGESSQPQTSLAETVYQGVYGPCSVDSTDVREVHNHFLISVKSTPRYKCFCSHFSRVIIQYKLYRSGLVTAATSFVVAAYAAFLPDNFFLTGILKHNLDFVYAIGAGGLGLSLFLIHIYVTEIKRTLQAFWVLGVARSLATYACLASPAREGFVQYVVDNPIAIWFVGPLFASLTGLVFKEGLCYGKLEAGILTFIIPTVLLGHLALMEFMLNT